MQHIALVVAMEYSGHLLEGREKFCAAVRLSGSHERNMSSTVSDMIFLDHCQGLPGLMNSLMEDTETEDPKVA
jgi:hypothetical protein